jgi:kinesin family protein C2/C3
VDLAGSERVDRSEVKGDRLREAQHINKSLSSLGDVIFSLASKSSHIPYRNSKLTQILQSSLGGRAKTLMFVQLNPDATSYSESMSTLKFAERVSGVELGAAKSSKDGKDVRDLMEQLASLKDTIARKDEEIERLQSAKDVQHPQRVQKPMLRRKSFGQTDDINSDTSMEDSRSFQQSRHSLTDGESFTSSVEGEYEERLSEATSDVASVGTQGSPMDAAKRPPKISERAKSTTSRSTSITRPLDKLRKVATRTTSTVAKVTSGLSSSSIKKTGGASSLAKSSKRWA